MAELLLSLSIDSTAVEYHWLGSLLGAILATCLILPCLHLLILRPWRQMVESHHRAKKAQQASEHQYRLLAENVSDVIWILDLETLRFRYVSPSVQRLTGFTVEELLALHLSQLLTPPSWDYVRSIIPPRLEEYRQGVHTTYTEELFQYRKDGSVVPVEAVINLQQNETTGHLEALGVSRDLSSHQQVEQALRENERALREAQEIARLGSYRYHVQCDSWTSSPVLDEIFGIGPAYPRTMHDWLQLVHPMDRETMAAHLRDTVLRDRKPFDREYRIHRVSNGVERWVHGLGKLEFDAGGQILRMIGTIQDITERKEAEQALRRDEAELEAIYAGTPLMLCLVNERRQVERMNRALATFVESQNTQGDSIRPGDLIGCVHALDDPQGCGFGPECHSCPMRQAIQQTFTTGQTHRQIDKSFPLMRDGRRTEIHLLVSTALVRVQEESKVLLCLEDITTRKQLEAQLLQSQKMDALGQLAGGVAHDFNNILASLQLHLEVLQQDHPDIPGLNAGLHELRQEAQRASDLTRQLLLFGRRQVMQAKQVDVNEVVEGLLKMLKRLLGEHITTRFERCPHPVWVVADPGMLEQVILNLCVNARDAMPKGGTLTLTIQQLNVGRDGARRHPDAKVGQFACLQVTDTGCGMDESTRRRIFEPFFTTKEVGKGTGLGLATVHGIVQQHHGWVEVESAPGVGASFQVCLPVAARPEQAKRATAHQSIRGGTETILLVEDEESLRRLVKTVLGRKGYQILDAGNGAEAIQVWEQHRDQIALLFTDMMMPGGMTGLDLAAMMRQTRPDLKVIVTSGYSTDLLQPGAGLPESIRYMAKPYIPDTLVQAIRDCLDQNSLKLANSPRA